MRASNRSAGNSENPRGRGRPVKTEEDRAEIRNRVLAATASAYAESGYHGLSVQAVLDKAGLSRPTFYKYFSNVDEPLEAVIALAHHGLVERLRKEIPSEAGIEEKMTCAVDLYLDWGKSLGPLLRPFYIELHDPLSPVSRLRPQVLQRISELCIKTLESNGFTLQNPLMVELMVTGIEFLGYRYHLERSSGKVTRAMINDAILRLVACAVARPTEAVPRTTRGTKRKR